MSSEPQEGSVREQRSAAEGTIVQNEEDLCRQRRLLDISWNPQLQLHVAVLPKHWMTEEEDLCNQQSNFMMEQEEPEPSQIKEELEEPEPPQIKEEQEEPEPPQIKEELQSFNVTDCQDEEGNQHEESTSTTDEETDPQNRDQRKRRDRRHVQSVDSSHMSAVLPQHWVTEEDLSNQQRKFRVKQEEPEPPQIKEEPGELCISQDEDQLDLKQETDTLMEIPTYEEDENSEADLNNQQSFNVTDSQDEEGNQHEESTSTTDEETEPQNRDQRKRRDRRHVQSVDSSHRCKRQCLEAFTVTAKETILENFNTIGTQDAQDAHLMSLISCKKPQRRRPRGAAESQERKWQYHYKVKLGDEEKVVCREAFASLHGIGTKRVRRVANHQSQGITPKDKRGTHNNRRCISDDLKGKVDEHIRSFPYCVSHYACHGTKRNYLASDLTVVKMYSLFLQLFYPDKYAEYRSGKDVKKIDCEVKFWFYYDYFKMNFNYGFGRPRSDVCSVCSEYQAKLKEEKNAAVRHTL